MYVNAKGLELKTTSTGAQIILNAGGGLRIGTSSADLLNSLPGSILKGGLGDDVYALWDSASQIVENADEGNDTVYVRAWSGYQLPDNVENAILVTAASTWATGNALNNLLVAGTVRATLDGGAGDDVLVGGTGGDVFKITAGNGSDVVYGFQHGWDAVKLNGYAFTSFDQLKAAATQVGDDVSIKLSATETLTLRDVALSTLGAADFGLPMTAPVVPAGSVHYGSQRAINNNGWYVFTNAWGVGTMKEGVDFTLNETFKMSDMIRGTTFDWSFALTTDYTQSIKAYAEVLYGTSPFNTPGNPTENKLGLPVKVSDLLDFTLNHDVSWSGNTSGFDVAYDIWFTSTPNGNTSTVTHELMIWVHEGDFSPLGAPVATYTDGGATARIYAKGAYVAVVFDDDRPVASINALDVINKLQSLGIMNGSEYLRSVELGAEVVSGAGQLVINDLNIQIAERTASGGALVKTVTGSTQAAVTTAAGVAPTLSPGDITSYKWNAQGVIVGSQNSLTFVDGHVVTQHYSAKSVFLGAEKTTVTAGVTTTQHYDGLWALTGTDKSSVNAQGETIIQHYDPAGILTSNERVVSDGWNTTAYVYDANMALDHINVTNPELTGGFKTITYSNGYQPIAITYVGSDNGDYLSGSAGVTHFKGGLGSDTLNGGSGVDYFHFDSALGQGDVDVINGFSSAVDKIVLDHSVFTALPVGALAAGAYSDGTFAQDASDRLIFDRATGSLWYDDDGNGAHAPILLAKIGADGALSAASFQIV